MIKAILEHLPYKEPFRFVDEVWELDENGVVGCYTYPEDSWFYRGHFPDNPITPGVILVETMAQIGLVVLGMYLQFANSECEDVPQFVFTSSSVDYLKMVRPNEQVIVRSEKIYFRLGKLKCKVVMETPEGEAICKGTLSGMIISS